MASPQDYPWTLNLVWKLLHNDPGTVSLFASNPFPAKPPRYVRAVLYRYWFEKPNKYQHVYWQRERLGLWLPPMNANDRGLIDILRSEGWIR